jgi:hypothetical protein
MYGAEQAVEGDVHLGAPALVPRVERAAVSGRRRLAPGEGQQVVRLAGEFRAWNPSWCTTSLQPTWVAIAMSASESRPVAWLNRLW